MLSEQFRVDYATQSQLPITRPVSGSRPASAVPRENTPLADSFSTVLQQQLEQSTTTKPLTFSGHALQRMQQRRINLSLMETQALNEACAKARAKGAKETLILADRAAFVVSVVNSTVITVLDRDNLKDNVFTQIDSAIVI